MDHLLQINDSYSYHNEKQVFLLYQVRECKNKCVLSFDSLAFGTEKLKKRVQDF